MRPFFGALIDARMCSLRDLQEHHSLDDACDLNEQLTARVENEWRAHDHAEKKAREKR